MNVKVRFSVRVWMPSMEKIVPVQYKCNPTALVVICVPCIIFNC